MTLQVIKAEDVRDGEPRLYMTEDAAATAIDALSPQWLVGHLHTGANCYARPSAIVDRPAPSTQPPPVLDLDALAEAERAMTAGLSVEAGNVEIGDTGEWDAYVHIVGRDGRVLVYMNSPEADRSLALARGIVALRNAAPHLIAEARAAVVLRQELAAMAVKLAEAKRLGLEACAHARALARGAPDVSTRDESVDTIVDALEAL